VNHRNNFDLLRFAFAFTVFLVHAHVLSGESALATLSRYFSSDFAIKAFFVVSGYLVPMSYEKASSLCDYAGKRIRRVYPAYFAIVVACAALGAIVTKLPPAEYLSGGLAAYLAANLVFLNFLAPNLPGVFAANPFTAVNGALWTLKVEVMFYAIVPLIAWLCRRVGPARVLAALYLASAAYHLALGHLAQASGSQLYAQLQRQLPGQLAYFVAGAAGFYFAGILARRWRLLAVAALAGYATVALSRNVVLEALLYPAVLAALVVYAAVGLRYLGNFGRFGDFSYGIYVVHFPLLQLLVSLGLFRFDPWLALGTATLAVLALAALSWHYVEKPFLRRSSHYVLAEAGRT
jgi:peptidoglycan/LPS O-acetylase OafA/YrhL